MRRISVFIAAGLLAATATIASADVLTSRILEWSPSERIVTFEGQRQMLVDTGARAESLAEGTEVSVMFGTDMDGNEIIYEVLQPGAYEGDTAQ